MPIKSKKKKSSFAEAASLADSLAKDKRQIGENYSEETYSDTGYSTPGEEVIIEETVTESKQKKGSKKKKTKVKKKGKVPNLVDVAKKEPLVETKTTVFEKRIEGDASIVEKPFLGLRGGFFETFGGILVVLIIIELIVILALAVMLFIK